MRVLVVAEGEHEIDPDNHERGALAVLAQRLMGRRISVVQKKVSDPEVRIHATSGRGEKLTKRALNWSRYAERNGFDAIVLIVDVDRDRSRQRALDSAQHDQRIALSRAFGVAIRSFDAWMLADEQAIGSVIGRPVLRQPDPEEDRDPKASCQGLGLDSRYLYRDVARQADLAELSKRCQKGFGPFAARVRNLQSVFE